MSAYREIKSKITDKDCLVKALEEKGFHPVVHDEAKHLVDYVGKTRPQTAEVVITRKEAGSSSNEVGFKKMADGTYQAIISEFDSTKFNAKWLEDVTSLHARHKIKKIAKIQGLKFIKEETVNGSTQMIYERA